MSSNFENLAWIFLCSVLLIGSSLSAFPLLICFFCICMQLFIIPPKISFFPTWCLQTYFLSFPKSGWRNSLLAPSLSFPSQSCICTSPHVIGFFSTFFISPTMKYMHDHSHLASHSSRNMKSRMREIEEKAKRSWPSSQPCGIEYSNTMCVKDVGSRIKSFQDLHPRDSAWQTLLSIIFSIVLSPK